MPWLLIGNALQGKLGVVAIALTISALRLWTRGATANESHVLDALVKSMFHNRIIPINERREAILLPEQVARIPFFWSLEDETQALFVGLALHTVQSTTPALEPHLLRLPKAYPISRLIGTSSELLRRITVNVIGNPGSS